jgi:hypothetical protein
MGGVFIFKYGYVKLYVDISYWWAYDIITHRVSAAMDLLAYKPLHGISPPR